MTIFRENLNHAASGNAREKLGIKSKANETTRFIEQPKTIFNAIANAA